MIFRQVLVIFIFLFSMHISFCMDDQDEIAMREKEIAEKEFVALIGDPFALPEAEMIAKLTHVLALGVNPHKGRKSFHEMCTIKPLDYLLFQLQQANPTQKSCIERMIYLICPPYLSDEDKQQSLK